MMLTGLALGVALILLAGWVRRSRREQLVVSSAEPISTMHLEMSKRAGKKRKALDAATAVLR